MTSRRITTVGQSLICGAGFLIAGGVAEAADVARPTVPMAAPAEAALPSWYVHVGPAGIFYDSSAKLYAGGAQVPGATAKATDNVTGLVELGYFFNDNIAASLTVGVPPKATLTAKGTVSALGTVGKATYGPAALTVHYHLTNFGAFQPYAGLGGAYAFIFDEEDGAVTQLKVKGAPGFVLQGGFDYNLNKNWGVFVDVKKLWLAVDVEGNLGPTPVTGKVTIDPLVVHSGVTYRF